MIETETEGKSPPSAHPDDVEAFIAEQLRATHTNEEAGSFLKFFRPLRRLRDLVGDVSVLPGLAPLPILVAIWRMGQRVFELEARIARLEAAQAPEEKAAKGQRQDK